MMKPNFENKQRQDEEIKSHEGIDGCDRGDDDDNDAATW